MPKIYKDFTYLPKTRIQHILGFFNLSVHFVNRNFIKNSKQQTIDCIHCNKSHKINLKTKNYKDLYCDDCKMFINEEIGKKAFIEFKYQNNIKILKNIGEDNIKNLLSE